MIRGVLRPAGAIILAFVAGCSAAAESAPPAPPAQPASAARPAPAGAEHPVAAVSDEQAERGRVAFRDSCLECHGSNEFRGQGFLFRWGRRTAWDFFRSLRQTMPESLPGSLPDEVYVDVVAYVLTLNGYAGGGGELLPTEEALGRLPMDGGRHEPALRRAADAP